LPHQLIFQRFSSQNMDVHHLSTKRKKKPKLHFHWFSLHYWKFLVQRIISNYYLADSSLWKQSADDYIKSLKKYTRFVCNFNQNISPGNQTQIISDQKQALSDHGCELRFLAESHSFRRLDLNLNIISINFIIKHSWDIF
jgi:hypothetical protein